MNRKRKIDDRDTKINILLCFDFPGIFPFAVNNMMTRTWPQLEKVQGIKALQFKINKPGIFVHYDTRRHVSTEE